VSGRTFWVLSPDGTVHLPVIEGPGLVVTLCGRSLLGQCGGVPERRRCPECFAAYLLPPDLVITRETRLATGRILPHRFRLLVGRRYQLP
jgi:hypothetical protein